MTHLRIELNNGIIEEVSSAVIDKLYDIVHSGNLDNTSNLIGRLNTTATYLEYIDAIRAEYPDLYITANKYYLYLGDPTFTLILANAYGDGTGCILSDLTSVNTYVENAWGLFYGNTDITDATGLKYFTNIYWNGSHPNLYNGFRNCTNLQRCELPEGMINLEAGNGYGNTGFFKNCLNLAYVKLPSTLKKIGLYSFYDCSSLQNINIPTGVTFIGESAFNGCSLSQITLPSSLETISAFAFSNNNITSLYIPSSVTEIFGGFVSNCSNLTSIIFDQDPGNNLIMHSGGGYLRGAFAINGGSLTGITTLDFPERLTTMSTGDSFFANLPNLTTVIFRSTTPPTCSSGSLYIPSNCTIYVPDASVSAYQSATVFSGASSNIKGISELPST